MSYDISPAFIILLSICDFYFNYLFTVLALLFPVEVTMLHLPGFHSSSCLLPTVLFGIAEGVKVQKINNKLYCPLQGITNAGKQLLESPLPVCLILNTCEHEMPLKYVMSYGGWPHDRSTGTRCVRHFDAPRKGALVSSVEFERCFIEMNRSSSGKRGRATFSQCRKISFWFNEMFYLTHVILFAGRMVLIMTVWLVKMLSWLSAISVPSSTSFLDICFLLYPYRLCRPLPFQHK